MSTATKTHTPGPWKLTEYTVAQRMGVTAEPYGDGYQCVVADVLDDKGGFPEGSETLANARLIAAAPELLEALERVRDKVHATVSQEGNLKRALQTLDSIDELVAAVIRRARGGE